MPLATAIRILLAGLVALAIGAPLQPASASPYRPARDADILERLPARPLGPAPARERALRELVRRQPGQLDLALRYELRALPYDYAEQRTLSLHHGLALGLSRRRR